MGLKMIYPETQTGVVASSYESAYPADNLLDNKIKKVWRAESGVSPVTVTVTSAGGDNCVALFGIAADAATVTVKDAGGSTVSSQSFNLGSGDARVYRRLWYEYTLQAAGHEIEIQLTKAAGQVEAGVVRAGAIIDLAVNPKYGIQEGREDQSIVKKLSNGALYTRIRDIQRTYDAQLMPISANWYALTDLYDSVGPGAIAMLLVDGVENRHWCVFGHMVDASISGSHDRPTRVSGKIKILEAV